MGYTRWDSSDWDSYSTTNASKSTDEIFSKNELSDNLNPFEINRESRDSDNNPESTPIIVGCDVTGSMGMIADTLVREGLGTLFEEILDRKPVTDPHLMVAGIGDATMHDTAPLQVSQFEADLKIADWLEEIYIEKGGGGNNFESYDLPVYFAAYHTSTDAFEKRGKRGYLFTIGDEEPPKFTEASCVKKFIGDTPQADVPFADVIEAAEKMYNYYHIIVAEGSHMRYSPKETQRAWKELLGQRAILLSDYMKLSEVIVSIIEVNEGRDKAEVAASWSGDTSLVVQTAVSDLVASSDGGMPINTGTPDTDSVTTL